MYGFTTCYLATRINIMTSGNESLSLYLSQLRLLKTMRKNTLENIVGKGENAGYQHFLLFQRCSLS